MQKIGVRGGGGGGVGEVGGGAPKFYNIGKSPVKCITSDLEIWNKL